MISLLILPAIAISILVTIHTYFGTHVIKRGIIFVDLALAQWAALGYLLAHALHIESSLSKAIFSLATTGLAAFILALIQLRNNTDHQQEANIGIMYLLATTLATVIMSTAGIEGHHFTEMLVGHLLFVSAKDIAIASLIYACIAGLHWAFYDTLSQPKSVLSHFAFYASFGVIVTSSVKLAGVLVVFALLIIPALISTHHQHNVMKRLGYAYLFAIPTCIIGIVLGYFINIPLGYAVILSLCALWMGFLLKQGPNKKSHGS
ncbi:MAG: metal ABC transporter permease [bacterium]|nr:metal ABC transporter permease [bacterium]